MIDMYAKEAYVLINRECSENVTELELRKPKKSCALIIYRTRLHRTV